MDDIFFEKPEMKKEKKGRNKTLGYDPRLQLWNTGKRIEIPFTPFGKLMVQDEF